MHAVFVDRTTEMRRVMAARSLPIPATLAVSDGDPTTADLIRLCRTAHVMLVEHSVVEPAVFDACPSIRTVIFMGTGAEAYVDLDDARHRGIAVHTTPGYGDQAVAEHAVALMLSAARNVVRMDRAIRSGTWRPLGGLQLQGRKLAVVGMGGIGTAVAKIALALGMRVAAWNRTPRELRCFEPNLDEALRDADVVTLHLRLNAATNGLLDERRLRLPKKGFVLVNTARAALVPEQALLGALADGQIGHAALDVFHVEPLPDENPYAALENVTLTAHAAYMTDEAYAQLWMLTLQKLASLQQHGEGITSTPA